MFAFPDLELVCCSMSGSNCCVLTFIQISQETGQVVWYSYLLKNFPQSVVIHTVKGFGISRSRCFSGTLAFSMIQQMLALWSQVPLPFLNPVWTSGISQFTYCWSTACRFFSITLLECKMIINVWYFEHSLTLPFFGIGMKTDIFQSCGHFCVFQICQCIGSSTFITSSFRTWNSSAGKKKKKK